MNKTGSRAKRNSTVERLKAYDLIIDDEINERKINKQKNEEKKKLQELEKQRQLEEEKAKQEKIWKELELQRKKEEEWLRQIREKEEKEERERKWLIELRLAEERRLWEFKRKKENEEKERLAWKQSLEEQEVWFDKKYNELSKSKRGHEEETKEEKKSSTLLNVPHKEIKTIIHNFNEEINVQQFPFKRSKRAGNWNVNNNTALNHIDINPKITPISTPEYWEKLNLFYNIKNEEFQDQSKTSKVNKMFKGDNNTISSEFITKEIKSFLRVNTLLVNNRKDKSTKTSRSKTIFEEFEHNKKDNFNDKTSAAPPLTKSLSELNIANKSNLNRNDNDNLSTNKLKKSFAEVHYNSFLAQHSKDKYAQKHNYNCSNISTDCFHKPMSTRTNKMKINDYKLIKSNYCYKTIKCEREKKQELNSSITANSFLNNRRASNTIMNNLNNKNIKTITNTSSVKLYNSNLINENCNNCTLLSKNKVVQRSSSYVKDKSMNKMSRPMNGFNSFLEGKDSFFFKY